MRAVIRRGGQLVLDQIAAPQPGPGQVLVKTLSCGICGSDLHALDHLDELITNLNAVQPPGMPPVPIRHDCDMVFGHEFSAEILEFGPDCQKSLKAGTAVCGTPFLMGTKNGMGYTLIGYSNEYPGGFGEYMVLSESTLLPVPNGLHADHAALVEPFSVGAHAVARAEPEKGDVLMVIGCGPVGLAVIAALKARGLGPIIASDFSARRRELAVAMGAHEVIDPAVISPHSRWQDLGVARHRVELAAMLQAGRKSVRPIIFECVGIPGMLQSVIAEAPLQSRIIVLGVCMNPDSYRPFIALNKEIDLRFSFGYTPPEYAATLADLSEGRIDVGNIVTGAVPLEGVDQAFKDLSGSDQHAKIVVHPWA